MAERLSPYASGSHSALFSRPTSARPDGPLVCFALRGLPERLKPPALLLCLDAIWRQLEGPLRRRCVLVDEAWLLMREPAGARFLFRLAKSSRKRWCGLTAITQDAPDLLGSELGQAVVSNAATQLLLRQAPQASTEVGGGGGLAEPTPTALADIPPQYLLLYEQAGLAYGVPWPVLAGIGKLECDHGRSPDPACWQEGAVNYAGAGGPMQFLAATWARYGVDADADGDGKADRW